MGGETEFLSVEQVVTLHDELVHRFGGSSLPGHRGEWGGVTAAVLAVENSYYEDVFEPAAAYAVYVVLGHAFGDGNKRTGSAACLVFLASNGIALDLPPDEVVDRMLELQKRAEVAPAPPAAALVEWLADWLRAAKRATATP